MNNLCSISLLLLMLFSVIGGEVNSENVISEKLNEFSVDLHEKLTKNKGNHVYSGYSLANILALTSLGSRGATASQIQSALKLNLSNKGLESGFKKIDKSLKNAQNIIVETANKAYLADGLVVEPEFSETASANFDAEVENVHFNNPKETAHKINAWVEKKTHNKIKNLVDEKQLSSLTRLVLVNTLYFSGKWKHPFAVDATEKKDFHNFKSNTVKVDMMKMSANLPLYMDSSLEVSVLTLPYQNPRAELAIILPNEKDGLEAAEQNLQKLCNIRNFTLSHVTVSLPKFRIESTVDMIPLLKQMGITNLFTQADLSGITKEPLTVSSITQKTFIEVDEDGTEASSATSVVADNYMAARPVANSQVVNIDHGFLFAILYDGIALLAGRVEKL